MRKKSLGKTGPQISVVGFGAWEIGGAGSDARLGDRAISTMTAGFDAGMTWVDTAEFYGMGRSEELVGKAVATRPDVLVFSKVGPKPFGSGVDPVGVRAAAEASLKRLRREVIDLYLAVEPDPSIPVEETWSALAGLVEIGLVRLIGLSNLSAELVDRCERIRHVDAIESHYSLVHRDEYEDLGPFCKRNGTAFLAYGPLALGVLTGKVLRDTGIREMSWGKDRTAADLSPYQRKTFAPEVLPKKLRFVDALRPLAERKGVTLAQLALSWVVLRDTFTVAIAGSTSREHTIENAAAGGLNLSESDIEEIGAVVSRQA